MFFPYFLKFPWQKIPCCDALLVNVGMGVALHVFSIVYDIFEICDPFVSMLIAIGFELVGMEREEWLYYLIGLHFLQKTLF